jgi:hypothetical protein
VGGNASCWLLFCSELQNYRRLQSVHHSVLFCSYCFGIIYQGKVSSCQMFHSRQAFVKICSRGSRRTSRQIHQVQNKTSNVTRGRINLNRRNDLIVAVSQSICVKNYPHSVTVCVQLVVIFYYLFCECRPRQCPYVQISFI